MTDDDDDDDDNDVGASGGEVTAELLLLLVLLAMLPNLFAIALTGALSDRPGIRLERELLDDMDDGAMEEGLVMVRLRKGMLDAFALEVVSYCRSNSSTLGKRELASSV